MAKTKVSEWSSTPGNNTDIDSINIAENCPPSGINDAIRELMSQVKDWQAGTTGDSFNGPVGTTTAAAGAFTTLTTSGAVTHNGGTANGVAYLNGSKVLTSGSALTFDGTTLSNTVADNSINYKAKAASGVLRFSGYTPAFSGSLLEATNAAESAYAKLTNAASSFVWSINGAGQAAILDSSGNLGLGVTPSAWGSSFAALQLKGLYGGALSTSASSNTSTNLSHSAYHNGTNWIYGYTGVGAARYEIDGPAGGATHKWFTAPSGTAGNAITFTQAMTLDASGNLLVGTTSNTTSFTSRLCLSYNSGTTNWAVGPWVSTPTNFYISANGGAQGVYLNGATATSWTGWSDERIKDELLPIENAAEKVCTLRAVTGVFKEDETKTRKVFLIAQDVLAVLPEAVDTSNPDRFGLSYTDTIPLLVAAIQEQQALIVNLQTRLAAAGI